MDINAILNASKIIDQWKASNNHVAPWTESQILEIVQTYDFQSWFHNNPNGTIDQYYIYLSNRQAYQNSPQYKIKNLEAEIENMSDKVETLNRKLTQYKEEISIKEERISYLETLSSITLTTSFILMIVSFVLFYLLRKRYK